MNHAYWLRYAELCAVRDRNLLLIKGKRAKPFPRLLVKVELTFDYVTMAEDNIIQFNQPKPESRFSGTPMKSELVEKASEVILDPQVLINMVSRRVKQLSDGRSPLIETVPSMGSADIALIEIIEGKIKLAETPAE